MNGRLAALAAGAPRAVVVGATMPVIRRWRARARRDASALIDASPNGRSRHLVRMDQRATRVAHLFALLAAATPPALVASAAR